MRRERFAGELVVRPEQRTDEHERRPRWHAQSRAKRRAFERVTVGLRDEVTLHERLVGGVFLQIPERAVEQHHPEISVLREVELKTAEAEFMAFRRQVERR